MLLPSRRPPRGIIFHSDRANQYAGRECRSLLVRSSIRQRISARITPYHHAWTESFMATLKTGMLHEDCFIDGDHARTGLVGYIESYCNIHRKHSSPAHQSQAQFQARKASPN